MESADRIADTHITQTLPEKIEEAAHRLSHIPFCVGVGLIGVWSVAVLLYRIAGY